MYRSWQSRKYGQRRPFTLAPTGSLHRLQPLEERRGSHETTSAMRFDYATAFSRNIGWLTEAEQERLRHKRVAIAGMGGVGGVHLTTLARLGIARFSIADLDTFELANFNRQAAATVSTLGCPKVDTLA